GVGSVAISPDGKRLASGGVISDEKTGEAVAGEIKIWDLATGRQLFDLEGHTRHVTSLTFSPDGKWLASASLDRTVRLWDAAAGKGLRVLKGHNDSVSSVAEPDRAVQTGR